MAPGWTVFYWAWWVSWTPFVGTFIARISRGRTIRQFVIGVLLVPCLVSLVWFAIFGGGAIHMQQNGTDLGGESSAEGLLFVRVAFLPGATATTGSWSRCWSRSSSSPAPTPPRS